MVMKAIKFSDVLIGGEFTNPPENDVFTKLSNYSATKDGIWEDGFVPQEPVLTSEI